MAIEKTSDKMIAVKAFINTWLKDPRVFCAACGKTYKGIQCCPNMYIVDNKKRLVDFVQANKESKELLFHNTGKSKGGNMRSAIRMPAELMRALQSYFRQTYNETFLSDKKEGRKFMRTFPMFCSVERV